MNTQLNSASRRQIKMSSHPNALLLLALTPDNLARKTYRAILEEYGQGDRINISGKGYYCSIMEEGYDQDNQISAKEGDIILCLFATYGYGERIAWDELEANKHALEGWAKGVCKKHRCSYEIFVSANYW